MQIKWANQVPQWEQMPLSSHDISGGDLESWRTGTMGGGRGIRPVVCLVKYYKTNELELVSVRYWFCNYLVIWLIEKKQQQKSKQMQYFPALLNKFPFYRLQLFGEKPHDVRFKMLFFLTVDV